MCLADVESRSSSANSQPCELALTHSPRGAVSSEWAAIARHSTPGSIPLTATVQSESRRSNHSEEARSCKPGHLSVIRANAPQQESEAALDDALDIALHTTQGPDPCEYDSTHPQRVGESCSAFADGALAVVATSASHESDIPPVTECSPTDAAGGVALPEPIRRPRRPPKVQPAKRRRQARTTHGATAVSGEEVPTHKRRKVAASDGIRRSAQSAVSPAQKRRTRASEQGAACRSASASYSGVDQVTNYADASFEEWPLPDAVLQRIQTNDRATLQLQFTWAMPCASHTSPDAGSMVQSPVLPGARRDRGTRTRARAIDIMDRGAERIGASNTSGENNIFAVARLLARWKTGTYFLEWADGTTSWEPKRNILDRRMIDDFETTYRGFNAGIDVLASRTRKGRQQWRVHWHGRPPVEDCWVDGRLMDPTKVEKV
jgi:hypothetical protein